MGCGDDDWYVVDSVDYLKKFGFVKIWKFEVENDDVRFVGDDDLEVSEFIVCCLNFVLVCG